MNISPRILHRMTTGIAAGSPLLKQKLKPGAGSFPGAGFSDLFAAALGGYREAGAEERPAGLSRDDHCCFALEYIFEGFLLHYGKSRLLVPDTQDFNLLAGDYMYAKGLDYIARLEDPAYIKMFAGLVSLCSYASCEKLDPGVALKSWAAAALCLAAGAAGRGKHWTIRMEELKNGVWNNGRPGVSGPGSIGPVQVGGAVGRPGVSRPGSGSPGASALLEELLAIHSDTAAGLLRSILGDIYSLYGN